MFFMGSRAKQVVWLSLVLSTNSFSGVRRNVDFTDGNGRYIGRLSNGWMACTATLVSPQHILTAAHCINAGLTFALHYKNGVSSEEVAVERTVQDSGYNSNSTLTPTDWAIGRLARPIGLRYGWAEVSDRKLPVGSELSALGYSSDWQSGLVASEDTSCKIIPNTDSLSGALLALSGIRFPENVYMTNCQITNGASGGPMMGFFTRVAADGSKFQVPLIAAVNHVQEIVTGFSGGVVAAPLYTGTATLSLRHLIASVRAEWAEAPVEKKKLLPQNFQKLFSIWDNYDEPNQSKLLAQYFPNQKIREADAYLKRYYESLVVKKPSNYSVGVTLNSIYAPLKITTVVSGSPAEANRLLPGDVIKRVGLMTWPTFAEFSQAVDAPSPTLYLVILRNGIEYPTIIHKKALAEH